MRRIGVLDVEEVEVAQKTRNHYRDKGTPCLVYIHEKKWNEWRLLSKKQEDIELFQEAMGNNTPIDYKGVLRWNEEVGRYTTE